VRRSSERNYFYHLSCVAVLCTLQWRSDTEQPLFARYLKEALLDKLAFLLLF
jgi:hypothetical protein